MNRRAFVVVLGSLLGGCATDDGEPSPTTQEPTTTSRTTEPPTTTRTATSTETATETLTTTEEPTVTENERAAAFIETARQKLENAVRTYAGFGDGGTDMLSVDASIGGFNYARISNQVREATDALSKAERTATESQQTVIERLRGTGRFLVYGARCQTHLASGHRFLHDIATRVDENDLEPLRGIPPEEVRDDQAEAARWLATLREETRRRDVTALAAITRTSYTRVLNQLEAETTTLGEIERTFDPLYETYRLYKHADNYSNYEEAIDAEERFRDIAATFEDLDAAESMQDEVDRLLEVTQRWADKAQELAQEIEDD